MSMMWQPLLSPHQKPRIRCFQLLVRKIHVRDLSDLPGWRSEPASSRPRIIIACSF